MSSVNKIEAAGKQYIYPLNMSPIGMKQVVVRDGECIVGLKAEWDRYPIPGRSRSMVLVIAALRSIPIAQKRNTRMLSGYSGLATGFATGRDEIGVLPLRFECGHGRDRASIGENFDIFYRMVEGRNIGSFELRSARQVVLMETLEVVDLKDLVSRYQRI